MSENLLAGRVAIVTGAGSGVGRATALELHRRGMDVALLGRSRKSLSETAELAENSDREMLVSMCDVRDEASVASGFGRVTCHFGRIDAVILAAGIEIRGAVEDFRLESWNDTMSTNLTGAFLCSRAAIPYLKASDRGALIAIASGAARQGYPQLAAYSASKFGLLGLMESLAAELADDGVRVGSILPGSIMTPFGGTSIEEKKARALQGKKYIQPEDVARSIVYMLESPDRAWTQELNVWPS